MTDARDTLRDALIASGIPADLAAMIVAQCPPPGAGKCKPSRYRGEAIRVALDAGVHPRIIQQAFRVAGVRRVAARAAGGGR